MNNRISIPTIDKPEFINLAESDISPLMSKGQVKVFYIGQNRNGSFINKQTATEMSKTLRGCPIVGWYNKDKQDFMDHGDELVINGDGVQFNCLTRPYGFIAPDAKIWFQFFEDQDEFGNTVVREYLVTECFLWTKQYEEAQRVLENHNPHSMELDDETLKGHWATDNNSGVEFFIINDATISKLCILGEEVEPCFEGSMFLPPETSSNFSKDNFLQELTSMAKELKFALSNKNDKGGISMENQLETPVVPEEQSIENNSFSQDNSSETSSVENQNNVEDKFEEKKEEKEEKETKEESTDKDDKEKEEDDEKKPSSKNSLEEENISLQTELTELQNKYALLEEENKKLKEFKLEVENKEKDELINSFYMLSDEDKKAVVENKLNYSLEEIEKELSVICVRKKVSFSNEESNENKTPTVFNLNSTEVDNTPAWLKAVDNVKKNND